MELKKNDKPRIIIILGPTASGKTAAALSLAQQYPIEIINADSMQVYRYMDIGTAKPSLDECACAPHHLFSIINPDQYYSAALFVEQGRQLIEDIVARGRLPVFVGGTGLYIRAVTGGLFEGPEGDEKIRTELRQKPAEERYLELVRVDPQSAVRINLHDTVRVVRALEVYYLTGKTLTEHHREHAFRDVPYCSLQIGLAHERHELHRSIEKRVDRMIEDGLVEEVAALLEKGYGPELKALQGIGYRQIIEFLQGGCTLAEAVIQIKKATKRFAKRQMTWFRREENIVWITLPDGSSLLDAEVKKFLYVD